MWPSMGCLPWAVTSFFSFSRFPFVLLFSPIHTSIHAGPRLSYLPYPHDLTLTTSLILCVCVCVIYLYLKLPPNVGVQKSVAVSDATGKVLDIGTRHSPRVLRSFVSTC